MYRPTSKGIEKSIESWKVIVPLYDNLGKRFRKEVIDGIKSKILREFGGFSAVYTVGGWKSGEQIFQDKNTTIIVDIPVIEHERASSFFADLKDKLREQLRQEKIYVTCENSATELLSTNEFFQELGFEIPSDQTPQLTQEEISRMVEQSDMVRARAGYKTLSLERNRALGMIAWEREILGIRISTNIEDYYPDDAIVLAADQLETYFQEGTFGKPLVVIGDYEYQSFILDKEKGRCILGESADFSQYDKADMEPLYGPHDWHGLLRTSEFIPTFVGQILINYIILRELGVKQEKIKIVVGSNGSSQSVGSLLLLCPAVIPDETIQKVIIDNFIRAMNLYESGTIDEIALMQAKVMNRYNEKKAIISGSRKLMTS
jgi:hypothetical protein